MFDLVIRNGTIVDGTGQPGFKADIAVAGDRVVRIGEVAEQANREIDATGMVVSPGFIDVHTHYDAQAFWDPKLSPSSNHGVTTILAGNCGFSIAPLSGRSEDVDYLLNMLARVEGMPVESLREGVPWNWRSFGEFLDGLEGALAINAGFLVGHSAIRRTVMGERAMGCDPTPDEMQAMKDLLEKSIAEGGLGFSTTTSPVHNDADGRPVPSRYAKTEEFVELARVAGQAEGTYLEMVVDPSGAFSDETLNRMSAMSAAAGRSLNWNLLSPNSKQRAIDESRLAASDYAAERGGKIYALLAPRPMTVVVSFAAGMFIDIFPGFGATMKLAHDERKQALADPALRVRLNDAMNAPDAGTFGELSDWSQWRVIETALPKNKELDGQYIGAIASRLHKAPLDVLLDLAIEEDLQTLFCPKKMGADEESWRMRADAFRDARTIIGGSDAGAHLDMVDSFAFTSHVLGEVVRERRILPLEEAVHRMTGLPASIFGLRDRGTLREGSFADIVVFDPDHVDAGPIYKKYDLPGGGYRLYCDAIGVRDVIVNGRPIIRGEDFTGDMPGAILRSGKDTYSVPV